MKESEWHQIKEYLNQQCSLEYPNENYAKGRWKGYNVLKFICSKVSSKENFILFVFYLKHLEMVYGGKETDEAIGFSRSFSDVRRKIKR